MVLCNSFGKPSINSAKGESMSRNICFALVCLAFSSASTANLNKCIGANGSVTYSDVMCKANDSMEVKAKPVQSAPTTSSTRATVQSEVGIRTKTDPANFPANVQSSSQSELQVRADISSAVAKAFLQRDFKWLELKSHEYRDSKARSPSGIWLLTTFYVAIGDAISRTTNNNPNNFNLVESIATEWESKYPESPTAHIVRSLVYHYRGTSYRGDGFAASVDPDAWKPFREMIAAARSNLEQHKSISSVDPAWYELMLMIGRMQGWKKAEFQQTLEEALKREPLFYQTYFAALEYFLPKWGGSIAEVEQFARASIKRTASMEGKGMYSRIYWYASQTQFGGRLFVDSAADWSTMSLGFEDVIAKYPDSWNLSNYAKFACLAQDKSKLDQLFTKLGANLVPQAWPSPVLIGICQNMAHGPK